MAESPKHPPVDPVLILHPAFLAVFPILGLYAHNVAYTPLEALWRPLWIAGVGAMALWFVLALALRRLHKAAVVASLLVITCLSGWQVLEFTIHSTLPYVGQIPTVGYYVAFGLLMLLMLAAILRREWSHPRKALAWAGVAAATGLLVVLNAELALFGAQNRGAAWYISLYLVFAVALLLITLRASWDFKAISRTANWFGAILVVLYVALIAFNRAQLTPIEPPPFEMPALAPRAQNESPYPDIYVILLRGYPRADMLRSQLGFNNLLFEEEMAALGFQTAARSTANYTDGGLSLAALLNMDYVQALVPETCLLDEASASLYRNNRAFQLFRQAGYAIAAFSTGFESMELYGQSDLYLAPPHTMTEFELVFFSETAGSRALQWYYEHRYANPAYWRFEPRRKRIEYAFTELPKLAAAESDAPRLVVAALAIPAPPFLFTREGLRAKPFGPPAVGDDTAYQGTAQQFFDSFTEQIQYASQRLLETAKGILTASRCPPVIIIASGQGIGGGEENEETAVCANALWVRFPEESSAQDAFPENLSLVNVLRITANHALGAQLPLLPDTVYAATGDTVGSLQASAAP